MDAEKEVAVLPKAILLDLDDTLISYDGASDVAWREVCKRFSEEFPSENGILARPIGPRCETAS